MGGAKRYPSSAPRYPSTGDPSITCDDSTWYSNIRGWRTIGAISFPVAASFLPLISPTVGRTSSSIESISFEAHFGTRARDMILRSMPSWWCLTTSTRSGRCRLMIRISRCGGGWSRRCSPEALNEASDARQVGARRASVEYGSDDFGSTRYAMRTISSGIAITYTSIR